MYINDKLLNDLRTARKAKGYSQRELSQKSGVPQSHISKIESGAVDLRMSSLIALGRVLDLELELIPKQAIPLVQGYVQESGDISILSDSPAYSLSFQEQESSASAISTKKDSQQTGGADHE